jgi:hypothetical protein
MDKIRSDDLFGDVYEHPSFGQLTFGSCQGSSADVLFGSSIKHRNTIRMEIRHAEYNRKTGTDYIFGKELIVEAEMSPTQFADAITGLGSSSGTPITLRYVRGEGNIKPPEYVNKRTQFENEFAKTTEDIIKRLNDLEAKVNERKMPKWVSQEIDVIRMWLKSNHPFMADQFNRQMDKTVTEAKGEIEAYVSGMVRKLGIEAIRKQAPELPEPTRNIKELPEGKE